MSPLQFCNLGKAPWVISPRASTPTLSSHPAATPQPSWAGELRVRHLRCSSSRPLTQVLPWPFSLQQATASPCISTGKKEVGERKTCRITRGAKI